MQDCSGGVHVALRRRVGIFTFVWQKSWQSNVYYEAWGCTTVVFPCDCVTVLHSFERSAESLKAQHQSICMDLLGLEKEGSSLVRLLMLLCHQYILCWTSKSPTTVPKIFISSWYQCPVLVLLFATLLKLHSHEQWISSCSLFNEQDFNRWASQLSVYEVLCLWLSAKNALKKRDSKKYNIFLSNTRHPILSKSSFYFRADGCFELVQNLFQEEASLWSWDSFLKNTIPLRYALRFKVQHWSSLLF